VNVAAFPKEWRIVELGTLRAPGENSLVGGPFGSDLTTSDYQAEPGVPVIRGTNLGGDTGLFVDDGFVFVSEGKADSLRRNMAFPGDVVFTQRGTLGQVVVIPGRPRFPKYVISQSQMKLTPDEAQIDGQFLFHYFRSPRSLEQISARALTTGVPHINLGILKAFPVAVPPLAEQRRIAEVLDRAEALRAKRRAALAQLDTLTQAIFIDLFGDIGMNPKEWDKSILGDVATFTGGGTPSRACPAYFTGTVCWATSKDMKCEFLDETEEHITEQAIGNSATKLVPPGTILVVVKSKILAHHLPVAVARVPTCFGQDLKGITLSSRCEISFVATSLRLGARWLLERARGINTEGLTLDHLRSFPLLMPPLPLQQDFARRIAAVEKLKAAHRASLAELDALFAALQHRAFRGEL
jgi:type I restriction enzyme, S subunit